MTEETRNPAVSGPRGILLAIGASAILGWYIILGLLFSIQDFDATIATETKQPVAQVCDQCLVPLIFNECNVS
jgi:amino acid transporter